MMMALHLNDQIAPGNMLFPEGRRSSMARSQAPRFPERAAARLARPSMTLVVTFVLLAT